MSADSQVRKRGQSGGRQQAFFETAIDAAEFRKRGRRKEALEEEVFTKRETLELVRAFYKIRATTSGSRSSL